MSTIRYRHALALPLFACTLVLHASGAQAEPVDPEQLVFYPQALPADTRAAAVTSLPPPQDMLFARLGDQPDLAELRAQRLMSISKYQYEVQQVELQQGNYAPELFENLLGLGLLQQAAGDHEAALESLQRAALISKINTGLFSEEQIMLTQAIIDCLQASGASEEVQAQLERLVSLNRKQYGPDQPETALAMKGLAEWQLQSFVSSLKSNADTRLVPARRHGDLFTDYEVYSTSLEDLYEAQSSFLAAIRVLVEHSAFSNSELYELETDLLLTYYLNANREWMLSDPDLLWQNDARDSTSISKSKAADTLPADFSKGMDSYRRQIAYLKQNPAATLGQLTAAMSGLADWYQLFEQTDKAREQHRQIRTMLEGAGLDAASIAILTHSREAVVLPVFMQTPLSEKALLEAARGYVDVSITRNKSGRVSGVEIIGSSENTEADLQAHLLSLIRNSRFRVSEASSPATSAMRYYYTY